MTSIAVESVKLDQAPPVELYELDLTRLGGPVQRFCAQLNARGQNVVWQGQEYLAFPIRADGFEARSGGTLPRPRLTVSNAAGSLRGLVRSFDNLRGARLVRRRTLAKYLDAVNFTGGNALADPLSEFRPEVWLVDRCANRNRLVIEWELASPLDVAGMLLPACTVEPDHCDWEYRSSDCGYTGGAVAKADDSPTADLAHDRCSKRVSGCKLRFGDAPLPASFFPGVGQLRQV